jgi:hypothetical protein
MKRKAAAAAVQPNPKKIEMIPHFLFPLTRNYDEYEKTTIMIKP